MAEVLAKTIKVLLLLLTRAIIVFAEFIKPLSRTFPTVRYFPTLIRSQSNDMLFALIGIHGHEARKPRLSVATSTMEQRTTMPLWKGHDYVSSGTVDQILTVSESSFSAIRFAWTRTSSAWVVDQCQHALVTSRLPKWR